MWHDHPISQRKRFEAMRSGRGVGQNLKKGGESNIGGLHKIEGLGNSESTMKLPNLVNY